MMFDHPRVAMPEVFSDHHKRCASHDGQARIGVPQAVERDRRVNLGARASVSERARLVRLEPAGAIRFPKDQAVCRPSRGQPVEERRTLVVGRQPGSRRARGTSTATASSASVTCWPSSPCGGRVPVHPAARATSTRAASSASATCFSCSPTGGRVRDPLGDSPANRPSCPSCGSDRTAAVVCLVDAGLPRVYDRVPRLKGS